jgi:outer membrane protein assembly factor BamB
MKISLLVMVLMPQLVLASAWPQFRGANRDNGIDEKNLLRNFPKEGLTILWRQPVGPGYSNPIVADGRVYLSDCQLNNPKARERVVCFDENTGKPVWTHSYDVAYPDWVFKDPVGMGPTSTPIVHDGKIYSLGMMGHLCCLDARTGQPIWEKNLVTEYRIAEFSCRSSPLIEKNLLILQIGGKPNAAVVAFEKDSGKEAWKSLDEELSNSSPIVISSGGQRQLIVWTLGSVSSLNPANGEVFWREHLVTDNPLTAAAPVFNSGTGLLLAGGVVFKLDRNKAAAEILWPANKARGKRLLAETSTPMMSDGEIFWLSPGKEFTCLDAASGKKLWKSDKLTAAKTGNEINLSRCGEVVYIFSDEGNLICAQLSREEYKELGRAHLIDPTYPYGDRKVIWAGPAYANGRIFARSDRELVCGSLAGPG